MFNLRDINNLLLDEMIEQYARKNVEENKITITKEIMNSWFIVPILELNETTNTYSVELVKDYQDKLYVPIFTSYYNLLQCKPLKSTKVVICNFKLILKMYESIKNEVYNIVVNPYTYEMNFSKIDIAKIKRDFDMSIYREDLNNMEYIELPKNNVCSKYEGSVIKDVNIPKLFKKELMLISGFHKCIDSVYLLAKFDKKQCKNIYTIVIKQVNSEYGNELYLEEIKAILLEYLIKEISIVNLVLYKDYKKKNELKKIEPFYKKEK